MTIPQNIAADLKGRWRWSPTRTDLAEPAQAFNFAADLVAGLERRRAELSRDDGLTPTGAARLARAWMVDGNRRQTLIAQLGRMADAGSGIAAERAALATPRIDRTDLIGEMQRREIRDHLRKLPPGKQVAVALEDPAVAEAVLSATAFLTSALPADARDRIADAYAQRQHAQRLGQLDDIEEALGLVSSVQNLALAQAQEASGLDDAAFRAWWASGAEPDALPPAGQMTRAAFEALTAPEKMAKVRRGLVVAD